MSNVVPMSSEDQQLEQASRWVLRIETGLTAAEAQELRAWIGSRPSNRDVLLEVAAVWDKTESLSRLADLFPQEKRTDRNLAAFAWRYSLAGVTAILLVAIATLLLVPSPPSELQITAPAPAQAARYETAIGEQKTVLLPDGSEVVLNTDSRMHVTITADARVLLLERGEIHVEVAADPARPFSVIAGGHIVQAVGTAFSVEISDESGIEVLVTEGQVVLGLQAAAGHGSVLPSDAYAAGDNAQLTAPAVLTRAASNIVSAGESVTLSDTEQTRTVVAPDEIEVRLSWREGRLTFRSEPLRNVLDEVERYTTVSFVLVDEDLESQTLSGHFRAGDVDLLLRLLEANFDISYEYETASRVLLSRR